MIKKLYRQFYKINLDLFRAAKDPLMCHGPDHHERVCQNALKLAKSLKDDIDLEILIAACFLHDLTAYDSHMESAEHHAESKKIAQKILNKIKFSPKKIPGVLNAIAGHGSDPKYYQKDEAIETTVLRDADKMDALGHIGIARMIMARAKRGDSLKEIVDKFHGADIRRRWQAIKTKEARKISKENYHTSLEFFTKLNKNLKKTD